MSPKEQKDADTRNENKEGRGRLCLRLFLSFCKIGAFTFGGGYAMIPIIRRENAERHKWISEEDLKTLKNRNEKAVSYFEDNFTVFGIHHVDGRKTLGENYADLGGMECVTSLAKNKEDFVKIFERYAIVWGSKTADVSLINQLAYDEHSPDMIRVNAILATLSCFYDTYDVKEGDGMYIAPEKRISRWY